MAQKNKIKELVGRGLNSYHTKSLQQIDRIEKKNKEQSHKISILSNELDNDYLTKTEEGSVISLEHSKEGMIYLDELQGNTLVNYCTDGSKEMTLNGDIDVEGTFVTTTEGVDNGKVDVLCEGNTLVNLIKIDTSEYKTIGHASSNMLALGDASLFRNGIQYTIICEFSDIVGNAGVCFNFNSGGSAPDIYVKPTQGLVKHTFTMPTEPTIRTNAQVRAYYFEQENSCKIKNLIILEGDWTNKEIPSYFVGMKSVGQDDKNEHKIEILSQNKNLFKDKLTNLEIASGQNGYSSDHASGAQFIRIKPNTPYTLSSPIPLYNNLEGLVIAYYDINKKFIKHINMKENKISPSNARYCRVRTRKNPQSSISTEELSSILLQLEEGTVATSHVQGSMNKKEILMNEPLRGLSNSIKDRLVKISNKWFIEKNCEIDNVDGNKNWQLSANNNSDYCVAFAKGLNAINLASNNIISDTLPTLNSFDEVGKRKGIYLNGNSSGRNGNFVISVPSSECNSLSGVDGVKYWLQNNVTTVIYPRDTIIYEPLEIEPTLNTYNDITHISNNSIIPCNMKIKNSGYNAIIKPSTLYTVALDTDKSGTIGINLGGAKGTTTNNVATITTPATLTDDSLRLYGKGIKGSKVRLLEGDKTNWIPSFFEGMKSSFEDKLQDDGTYKMEILSNNSNVFNLKECIQTLNSKAICVEEVPNGFRTIQGKSEMFNLTICKFNPKGRYKVSYDITSITSDGSIATQTSWFIRVIYKDGEEQRIYNPNGHIEFATKDKPIQDINMSYGTTQNISTITNIKIVEMKSDTTEEYKSNKIQFSSIEPLRSVEDTKDKFVFKDGKLMIERNCGEILIDGSNCNSITVLNKTVRVVSGQGNDCLTDSYALCDKLTCKISWNEDDEHMYMSYPSNGAIIFINKYKLNTLDIEGVKEYLRNNNNKVTYKLASPIYEEIPFELQKIILEGYENGTLFFDTNIPPTSTATYAGETPIVKSVRLNKTEVLNNTEDINDNIIPYLMDMDYRVVMLQLATEELEVGVSMARLFGGAYEMLQRDIQSKRYSIDEYKHRLDAYLDANKITEEEYNKLGDMLNE